MIRAGLLAVLAAEVDSVNPSCSGTFACGAGKKVKDPVPAGACAADPCTADECCDADPAAAAAAKKVPAAAAAAKTTPTYPAGKTQLEYYMGFQVQPSGLTTVQATALRNQAMGWMTTFDKAEAFKTAMQKAMKDTMLEQQCCSAVTSAPAAATCGNPTCPTMETDSVEAACTTTKDGKKTGCAFTANTAAAPKCEVSTTLKCSDATNAKECGEKVGCNFVDVASTDKDTCGKVSGCSYTAYVKAAAAVTQSCAKPTQDQCPTMVATSVEAACTTTKDGKKTGCTFTAKGTNPKPTCAPDGALTCTAAAPKETCEAGCVFTAAKDAVKLVNAQCANPAHQACPAATSQEVCEVKNSGCKYTAATTSPAAAAKCERATPLDKLFTCTMAFADGKSTSSLPTESPLNFAAAANAEIYGPKQSHQTIALAKTYNRLKAAGNYSPDAKAKYTAEAAKITTANTAWKATAKKSLNPASAATGTSCKAPTQADCPTMAANSVEAACTTKDTKATGCLFTAKGANPKPTCKPSTSLKCTATAKTADECGTKGCIFKAATASLLELETDLATSWLEDLPVALSLFATTLNNQAVDVANALLKKGKEAFTEGLVKNLKAITGLNWDWLTAKMLNLQLMVQEDDYSTNWGLRLGVGLGVGLGVPALAAVAVGASMSGGHGGGGGHGTGHTTTTTTSGTMKNRRFLANAKHVSKAVVKGTTQAKKIVSGVAKHVAGGR